MKRQPRAEAHHYGQTDGPPVGEQGRLPDHVRKLLVLDAGRVHCNWGSGVLYNAFAERLSEVVGELKVPNLAVLNSTSRGQAAWASPDLGGSAFGHFFSQAMQGAADVEQGDRNGRVSLQELHRYVAGHVRQWTLENRADVQIPMLIPADSDMALVHAGPSARAASSTPASTPDPRWAAIPPPGRDRPRGRPLSPSPPDS